MYSRWCLEEKKSRECLQTRVNNVQFSRHGGHLKPVTLKPVIRIFRIFRVFVSAFSAFSAFSPSSFCGISSDPCFPRGERDVRIFRIFFVSGLNRWFRKSDWPALGWPALGDREDRGLPLPLERGVCETKSQKGCSRHRKSFMHSLHSARRGSEKNGLKPWCRKGPDHGAGLDPSLLTGKWCLEDAVGERFQRRLAGRNWDS